MAVAQFYRLAGDAEVVAEAARYPSEDVAEELRDRFEQAGASDEVFERWQIRELHERNVKPCQVPPLPQVIRSVAIQCIERMGKQVGSTKLSVFLGVAIFDAFCRCRGTSVEKTPTVCAAITGLVRKEDAASAAVNYDVLAQQASQFAEWLRSSGNSDATATVSVAVAEVHKQEREILDSLGWIVQLPTIYAWAIAIVSRLHALTQGRYAHAIQTMWQTNLVPRMRLLVLKQEASLGLSMREKACGLLSLGLHEVCLLPSEALNSGSRDAIAWDSMFSSDRRASPSVPSIEEGEVLIEHLAMACGSDVADVKAACRKVGKVMAEAMSVPCRRQPVSI